MLLSSGSLLTSPKDMKPKVLVFSKCKIQRHVSQSLVVQGYKNLLGVAPVQELTRSHHSPACSSIPQTFPMDPTFNPSEPSDCSSLVNSQAEVPCLCCCFTHLAHSYCPSRPNSSVTPSVKPSLASPKRTCNLTRLLFF